jgi:pimeloyl-ACP methyl ester carboxylesterase
VRTWGYVGRLAERYRVLVVDPLGHGLSDKPHDRQAFSKPDIAADADWERDLHRERSDPAATGAILEGSRRSNYRTDLNLISVSTLLYVADDDVADPDAANALGRDATALKIEAKILEGHNHDTAFEDSDSLVPLVISHLDAVRKPSWS